jgi:hypothetical protein
VRIYVTSTILRHATSPDAELSLARLCDAVRRQPSKSRASAANHDNTRASVSAIPRQFHRALLTAFRNPPRQYNRYIHESKTQHSPRISRPLKQKVLKKPLRGTCYSPIIPSNMSQRQFSYHRHHLLPRQIHKNVVSNAQTKSHHNPNSEQKQQRAQRYTSQTHDATITMS